jgi:hypothetical protein
MTGYGNNEFRKVTEIGSIGRTGPDAGGSGAMYQQNRRKREGDDFAHILAGEQTLREGGDISVKTTGYGPKGLPQKIMIQMKDYTFQ